MRLGPRHSICSRLRPRFKLAWDIHGDHDCGAAVMALLRPGRMRRRGLVAHSASQRPCLSVLAPWTRLLVSRAR